jgi:futalosine hydrolase
MHLLLCAATEFEIKPSLLFLKDLSVEVDVLVTGVGLTAASYSLTKSILSKKPGFILQAGIAGCLDDCHQLSDVVLIKNEVIGDLGVEEKGKFHSLFDLGLLQKDDFPWKNGKLENENALLNETGLAIVDGITVNEISTDPHRVSFYKNAGAVVESMEGAALHYIGLMENIPFLQVRALSNYVGERDKTKWEMQKAIANLNLEVQKILLKF